VREISKNWERDFAKKVKTGESHREKRFLIIATGT